MFSFSRASNLVQCCAKSRSTLSAAMTLRGPRQGRLASTNEGAAKKEVTKEAVSLEPPKKSGFSDILAILGKPSTNDRRSNNHKLPNPPYPDALPRRTVAPSGPFSTYAGRTRPVVNGDLGPAFRQLNNTLRNNNVAKDYRTQKFYEKPSNKRVRLNRERHRKRFLSGVKRLVNLVKEQRKFL